METEAAEVTDEQIYADLKAYSDAGMIDYVLPTDPIGEEWNVGWKGQILKILTKEGIVGFLTGIQVAAVFGAEVARLPVLEQIMALSRAQNALEAAGSLDGDPARSFLLDPHDPCELKCPGCGGIVSISCGAVFQGDGDGVDLDHEPTLGDLNDAASAHKCEEGA